MAKRAMNGAGSVPTGYATGHTTYADAVAACSGGDECLFTEGISLTAYTHVTQVSITVGVDSESGTGVADLGQPGTALWDATRARFNNTGPRSDGVGVTVTCEWLQSEPGTISGNNCFFSTDGSTMIVRNCFAHIDIGSRASTAYGARGQTTVSPNGGTIKAYYCVSTHEATVSNGGVGFYAWRHSSGEVIEAHGINCSVLQPTDSLYNVTTCKTAGSAGRGKVFAQSCQFFSGLDPSITIGMGSGGFTPLGTDGVGNNLVSGVAETVDLGTQKYEGIDIADEFEGVTVAGGLDWTPKFPVRRVGEDNSAEAAKNDGGIAVDFRGVEIKTFNIGAYDEGIGAGGGGAKQRKGFAGWGLELGFENRAA